MKLSTLDLTDSNYHNTEFISELKITDDQSFDSYHNSFFSSYWAKHTTLLNAFLNIEISGQGQLRLIQQVNGKKIVCAKEEIDSLNSKPTIITFSLSKEESSRYFFEVSPKANTEIIIKNTASWGTDQNTEKPVKLAIIMCTYNKKEYVKKNLDLLLTYPDFINSSTELFIVDNASNLNFENTDKLHYFAQGNYGGSGGFTRGLIEARKLNRFTHYQFMDDDILLDPDMIVRAQAFLSFQKEDSALSGAMLRYDKRNIFWEGGANYPHPQKNLTPEPCFFNTEITPKFLDKISKPYNFDYGGWWFFTFSENMVQKVGLPYPFFIRGDDVEYSLRLKKNGFTNICLPGVSVWHEAFFGKTGYWLQYYNTRNYIVFSLMYFSWSKSFKLGFKILKALVSDLLFFQYQKAEIINKAIFDIQKSIFSYHKLSTPEHQQDLLKSISHIKDIVLKEVKVENIQSGTKLDILLRLLTLNGHLTPSKQKKSIIIDSDKWKPRLIQSKFDFNTTEVIVSNKNNSQSFVFKKDCIRFFKISIISFFNIGTFILLIPYYKLIAPITFEKYKKTNFWNKFLKLT